MRKGFLTALLLLLTGAALPAQPPCDGEALADPGLSPIDPGDVFWSAPPLPCGDCGPTCHERVWFTAEYLLWWVRHEPISPTATNLSTQQAGVGPNAQNRLDALLDNGPLDFGTFAGVRLGAGFAVQQGWLLEGDIFGLERRAVGKGAASGRLRLQGGEINAAVDLYRDPSLSLEVLAGFRSMELDDDLLLINCYNHFYGGQVGGRAHVFLGGLDVGATATVALGTTQELSTVSETNPLRFYHGGFSYVPEVGIDLGYWITPQVRLGIGYRFLYWSQVTRPGNDLDILKSPMKPFPFQQSDFWAQGFNFGALFQY
jgi:hypothetical protein